MLAHDGRINIAARARHHDGADAFDGGMGIAPGFSGGGVRGGTGGDADGVDGGIAAVLGALSDGDGLTRCRRTCLPAKVLAVAAAAQAGGHQQQERA
ncbi:MAG TPA: hypothetical protein DD456_13515 [Stenotrophomonas sp.]|nr:hypothetical protein [Stenotrophomonas sp.]